MITKYAKLNENNEVISEEYFDSENLPTHKTGRLRPITESIPPLAANEVISGFVYDIYDHLVIKEFSKRTLSEDEYFEKQVPKREVALWAFKAVAKIHGYLDQIGALIAQLPEPNKTIAESQWEYATTIERDHPTTIGIAAALQLTPQFVDQMFVEAKEIQGY